MNRKSRLLALGICLGLVMLDQWAKTLAVRHLAHLPSLPVFSLFSLTYVENTGISFGMLKGVSNSFFLVVNGILITGLYLYWRRRPRWSLLFILSGALGNFLDRWHRGYVVDFFDFKVWPVFNVADSLITIGVIFYLWGQIWSKKGQHAP